MKKTHITFYFLFVLLTLICLIQFFKFESETRSIINKSIVSSIKKDLYIRVNSSKVNKRIINTSQSADSTTNGIRIITEETDSIIPYDEKHISKEEVYFDQSLMDQSATRILNPINPEKLHSLFQETLIKNKISTNSSILYIDKVSHQSYSYPLKNDNSFISYSSSKIDLGLEKEMLVVASVSFTITNLFRHQTDTFIIAFFLLIITILIYPSFYLVYKINQNKKKPIIYSENNASSSTNIIIKNEFGNYLLGKFTLDTKNRILKWDNQSVNLSKRREFLLLISLLESPNNCLTKDQAAKILEIHNYKCNNQLNSSITRLRALLNPDPSIVVESKKGVGYRLFICCDPIKSEI